MTNSASSRSASVRLCAALLPHVIEKNVAALRERQPQSEALRRYDRIGQLLTREAKAGADDAVVWVGKLIADLQISPLRKYGLTKSHVPAVIEKASQSSSMKPNPIQLTNDELSEILERAI